MIDLLGKLLFVFSLNKIWTISNILIENSFYNIIGVRIGIIFFSTTVLLSQLIVAIGGKFKLFWLMLLGRGFFGVSSENLIIS